MEPEDLLVDKPVATAVYRRIRSRLTGFGPYEVRTSKSQIAFRRERGFAYLWLPGRYLSNPDAEVVLSLALGRHDPSDRFKEVAHPTALHWMHHLEIHGPDEVDGEVVEWLHEAFDRAG